MTEHICISEQVAEMGLWHEVSKCDATARALADWHYSRQKPGSKELGPPGQKILLVSEDWKAVWGSHRPAPWAGVKRMDGFDGHCCFLFRNTGPLLSSTLIRKAIAYTCGKWGLAPFITYVACEKVRSTNPGYCFLKAGFRRVSYREKTKYGRMARLEMSVEEVKNCMDEEDVWIPWTR